RKVLDWENRSGGLTCVAFSPDGQMMATAGMRLGLLKSATGVVKWRQTKEGAVEQSLVVQDGPINSADFSPDGKTLALTTGYRWSQFKSKPRGLLKLVDLATGKAVKSVTAHEDSAEVVKFSPDGRFLATGGADSV